MAKANRLTRTDKAAKRLRNIKGGTGIKANKLVHTVNTYARVPVTLNGFLVSITSQSVVFRHKRTNASQKTRISTFPRSDVIECFGSVGEPSQLLFLKRDIVSSVNGYVTVDDTGAITVEVAVTGETSTIFPSDQFEVEVFADEDEKLQRKVGGGSKKKGKKAAPAEEDFEEEDDEDEEDLEDEDEEEELDEDDDLDDDEDEDEDEDLDDDEDEDEDEEDDEDLDDDEDLEDDDEDEDEDLDDDEDEDEDLDDDEDEDEDDEDL